MFLKPTPLYKLAGANLVSEDYISPTYLYKMVGVSPKTLRNITFMRRGRPSHSMTNAEKKITKLSEMGRIVFRDLHLCGTFTELSFQKNVSILALSSLFLNGPKCFSQTFVRYLLQAVLPKTYFLNVFCLAFDGPKRFSRLAFVWYLHQAVLSETCHS